MDRTLSSASGYSLSWKEKWPDGLLDMDSWVVASGLAGWSGTWKAHDWRIGDKEI